MSQQFSRTSYSFSGSEEPIKESIKNKKIEFNNEFQMTGDQLDQITVNLDVDPNML
jgi:hypothetical protein